MKPKPWEVAGPNRVTYSVCLVNGMHDWYAGRTDRYTAPMRAALSRRFGSAKAALQVCAQLCRDSETMRVIEVPRRETLDYDGAIVAEVSRGRLG